MAWRRLFSRAPGDRERAEEFEAHLHLAIDEYVTLGVTREEATRRARLRFGNPRVKRDEIDDLRRSALLESLWGDVRYAVRVLRRSPAFTLAAVATLALGIGATTGVFSVVQAVLLRPLPYVHPERLMGVSYRSADPKRFGSTVPSPPFLAWTDQSRAFEAFAAYTIGEVTLLRETGEPVRLSTAFISSNFFSVLGVPALDFGRSFDPFDGAHGATPTVLLSHRFSRQFFRTTERLIGETLKLNGTGHDVIGVTSSAFRFPGYATPDIFLPIHLPVGDPVVRSVNVIGRLQPTVSIDRAADELLQINRRAEATFPSAMRPIVVSGALPQVTALQRQIAGDLSGMLLMALGAAGCILLLACANVAGLLVTRMMSRERELAMRAALGATPRRLAQWLLAESLVLTTVGAAVGLLVLWTLLAGLRRVLAGAIPHADAIAIDRVVLAFTAGTVVLTSALCASIPVARIARRYHTVSLKLASSGAVRMAVRDSVRRVLVSGQVAVGLVLLIGALLLVNTLWRLSSTGLGFDPAHVLTLKISATGLGNSPLKSYRLSEIVDRLHNLPGVSSAGASTVFPLSGHAFRFTIPLEGEPPPPPIAQDATGVDVVSPGYLATMRIPLIAGRDFDDRDSGTTPPVAIINKVFARLYLDGRDPLGRHLSLGGGPQDANIAIIGVVNDVKDGNPGDDPEPTVYRPFSQAAPQLGWHTAALAIRTSSDAGRLADTIRKEISIVAPQGVVYDVAAMEDRVAATVAPQRQRAIVFGIFAAVAVVLAAVGLYGLLASVVAQSTHEFGVRLALGATRRELMGHVLRRGVTPTVIGILLGLGGALAFGRLLADRLYGVTALDAMTYAVAAVAMMLLSIIASGLPAYRATTVDPISVLRSD